MRRKPKKPNPIVQGEHVTPIEVSKLKGSICAWDGCLATFEGAMPKDWRWLLMYWGTAPNAESVVKSFKRPQFPCERDAALCPTHARQLDDLLKDLVRWAGGPMAGQG